MPWIRESEANRIKEKRELEEAREREEAVGQQNSNEEGTGQPAELPKKIPTPSYESTYEMRQPLDGDEEPPCTVVWPPPPQPLKQPVKTESQIERETQGGRILPRMRMPDPMPDPFFNPLIGPRARPDRNGTCTGMCSSWWPGEN